MPFYFPGTIGFADFNLEDGYKETSVLLNFMRLVKNVVVEK